jgi:hypothetical protein
MKINLRICDSGMSLRICGFAICGFACPPLPAKYRHYLHSHTCSLFLGFEWEEQNMELSCIVEESTEAQKRNLLVSSLVRSPNYWSGGHEFKFMAIGRRHGRTLVVPSFISIPLAWSCHVWSKECRMFNQITIEVSATQCCALSHAAKDILYCSCLHGYMQLGMPKADSNCTCLTQDSLSTCGAQHWWQVLEGPLENTDRINGLASPLATWVQIKRRHQQRPPSCKAASI